MYEELEFETLFIDNGGKLCHYVKSLVDENHFVEDIVQETFLEAWRKWDELCVHPEPVGWLFATANNKVRNAMRKAQAIEETPFNDEMEAPNSGDEYGLLEFRMFLEKILTPEEWIRFQRFFVIGYTASEMAEMEGISEDNFRVKLSRMMKKLRRKLRAKGLYVLVLAMVTQIFDKIG